MNPIAFALRRPITTLMLVGGLISGGVLGLKKMGVDVLPALDTSKIDVVLDYIGMGKGAERKDQKEHKEQNEEKEESPGEQHKILVTSPQAKDVVISQPYVCQIHSRRHIEVRALEDGYIQEILVSEGQAVKKGDLLFKIVPVLYKARADAKIAEARLAELEFNNTKRLADNNVVSQNELALLKAKLDRAQADADLAKAELDFTNVTARFDGIVDRLNQQLGSLVDKGDILTTLSDNSTMWVYFNVREAAYLEYMASRDQHKDERIELVLANHTKFKYPSTNTVIEAKFNNETGNIPFRVDFPNPDGLLRHGQTGTVLLPVVMKGAIVIPQRAVFEVLDKRYVYVVGKDEVVHQREIVIDHHEMEDVFIITKGLDVNDKIVLEGSRQLRDGEKVEYEFQQPEQVMLALKNHAE
jgi:membrane fusion protein (multidrug efflux system)